MKKDELIKLFDKYLQREPTEKELKIHGNKDYKVFEEEIQNCDERLYGNNNMNKIAILLSGHVRKNTILESFEKNIIPYDFDVFVHTWDNFGIKGNETKINDECDSEKIKIELEKIPNLIAYEIENNKNFIENLVDKNGYFNFSSPEKFIKSQLYSINKSYQLLENHIKKSKEKYSLVFKIRFDSDIKTFKINKIMLDDLLNNKIIFVPDSHSNHTHLDNGTACWACNNMYYKFKLKNTHIFEHTNVICDFYAYGNVESMKDYCNLYNYYDYYNEKYREINLHSYEKNKKYIKISQDGDYKFLGNDGHISSLYYYYCSYPERMLNLHLKEYMLVESKEISIKLVR
jgi:hypothetical protein